MITTRKTEPPVSLEEYLRDNINVGFRIMTADGNTITVTAFELNETLGKFMSTNVIVAHGEPLMLLSPDDYLAALKAQRQ